MDREKKYIKISEQWGKRKLSFNEGEKPGKKASLGNYLSLRLWHPSVKYRV